MSLAHSRTARHQRIVEIIARLPVRSQGQMLELLLDLDGDELYDQLVTYEADTGSSHLWDGEDEFEMDIVNLATLRKLAAKPPEES